MNEAIKITEWMTAVASVVSAFSVIFIICQLRLTKDIAQLTFEDSLNKEYRELCQKLPYKVFLKEQLSETELEDVMDEFYSYFDLSNQQVFLRATARLSEKTWMNWRDGIRANLDLPNFKYAWSVFEKDEKIFNELKQIIKKNFEEDPVKWKL